MNYCRMKDVIAKGGLPFNLSFKEPLIVLNNFTENNQVRQIGRSIQELFPSINLEKIKLENISEKEIAELNNKIELGNKCLELLHEDLA